MYFKFQKSISAVTYRIQLLFCLFSFCWLCARFRRWPVKHFLATRRAKTATTNFCINEDCRPCSKEGRDRQTDRQYYWHCQSNLELREFLGNGSSDICTAFHLNATSLALLDNFNEIKIQKMLRIYIYTYVYTMSQSKIHGSLPIYFCFGPSN